MTKSTYEKIITIYNCNKCHDHGQYYVEIKGLGLKFLQQCECKNEDGIKFANEYKFKE